MPGLKRRLSAKAEPPNKRSDKWQETMNCVVKSVVSIHFTSTTPFDTESAYASEATGFVVDAKRGYILTNRHVVGPGPFWGYAVFDNHEEHPVRPIYRDPIHDFGFLRFDPALVKHMPVSSLKLRPDLAKVGCEIRIVGNDAGEKLSILAGFISRLDRNAPEYGGMTYNDFNTEYIQAAAASSGGSSGSPVVDQNGHVVGLQAGGSTQASTDYFLPLESAKRALSCIQNGTRVSRGDIQVQWLLKPYDECVRLKLSPEEEEATRTAFPNVRGMLVADTVLPEGPAHPKLEEGDILLSVNGERVVHFSALERILDSNVGQQVELLIQRGGQNISASVVVGDLHEYTPSRFLQVSGAVFHDLSYQLARLYVLPVKGVYIAHTGLVFRTDQEHSGFILTELDNHKVENLDAFIEVMQKVPDRKWVSVKMYHISDMHTIRSVVVCIDRHWSREMRLAERNDQTGLWDFRTLAPPLAPEPLPRLKAKFPHVSFGKPAERCADVARSFVSVNARVPLSIEGYISTVVPGELGVVIDAEKGLVLVSRYAVPHTFCDVHLTVANSVVLPAKILFLHPQQNYAILKYDPELVDAPIRAVEFAKGRLTPGDELNLIGLSNSALIAAKTRVTDITTVSLPQAPDVDPRYRATNVDAVGMDTSMLSTCGPGILAANDGSVRGLYMTYVGEHGNNPHECTCRVATDAADVVSVVEQLRCGEIPDPRFVDVEMRALSVANARIRGVSEDWIAQVCDSPLDVRAVLAVRRVASSLADLIEEGDVIVSIDGELLTRAAQLMNLEKDQATIVVFRNGDERTIVVPTTKASSVQTTKIVGWAGLVVHAPHHAVLQRVKRPPSLVYISGVQLGSPGNQYEILSMSFITHVDRVATPTLDDFYNAVKKVPENTYVKLRIASFDGIPSACSIRTAYHYFDTWRAELDEHGEWQIEHENKRDHV